MLEQVREIIEIAGGVIELFAAAVIVFGFLRALVNYFRGRPAKDREAAFGTFRAHLGKDMLLGLEILIVADVIDSIAVTPSLQSLALLAFLVVIRTMISWSTSLQIEGRWPWQSEPEERKSNG